MAADLVRPSELAYRTFRGFHRGFVGWCLQLQLCRSRYHARTLRGSTGKGRRDVQPRNFWTQQERSSSDRVTEPQMNTDLERIIRPQSVSSVAPETYLP